MCFAYSTTYSQNLIVKVESKVNFGDLFYYYLKGIQSDQLFKTSVFYTDEFIVGQELELVEKSILGEYDIVSPLTERPGIAKKIGNIDNTYSILINRLDLPRFKNEILFFRDTTHLYEFHQQINGFDTLITDFDELLDELELYFDGYYSFRKHLNDKYQIVEYQEGDEDDGLGMTDDEFLAFEKEDFIADRVQRFIFNRNRLLGIGNTVYYFHQMNQIVSTNEINIDEVEILKSISLEEIDELFESTSNLLTNNRFDFEFNGTYTLSEYSLMDQIDNDSFIPKGIFVSPNGQERFESNFVIKEIVEHCNPFKKALRFYVEREYLDTTSTWTADSVLLNLANKSNVVLTIDWGDGSSLQTVNNYNTDQWIEHTYPDTITTYYPTTTLTWSEVFNGQPFTVSLIDGQSTGPDGKIIEIKIKDACGVASLANWRHSESSNWRLRSKIWFTQNFFGRHIGSYSESWVKNNNKWKQQKSQIRTTINGHIRNENCNVVATKYGERNKSNAKKADRTKTWLFNGSYIISNGEITSSHRLEKGSVLINATMVLNPCP